MSKVHEGRIINANNPSQGVIEYHERTKHHPNRHARSSGYLDWDKEPNPFRQYEGINSLRLPFAENYPDSNYFALYERKNNIFKPFSLENIGVFLELCLGLSAWKSYDGNTWPLRVNPSSGNLHPTEAHLILASLHENNKPGGVFHYNPLFHALEQRAKFDEQFRLKIREHFHTDGFLIGLTSIYWRESWKYGERAFRYCNHDVGHAMACLSLAANLLGWKTTYLNSLSSKEIEIILGLQKTEWRELEKEEPELLFFVHKNTKEHIPANIPSGLVQSFESLLFEGKPKILSMEHANWDVIYEVSSITNKPQTEEKTYNYKDHEYLEKEIPSKVGAKIIRQRRSAQAYDGKTSITKEQFFAILDKTIPRNNSAPFDLELGEVSVHLLIFAHRVIDLESGLYFLVRNEKHYNDIKQRCHSYFLWETIKESPHTLSLYLLKKGDYVREAMQVSCRQDIAGDGAFSVGMIARFKENIENQPFIYRQLFWETGMIGQVLYLEAEAHSVRGTGIGCFYDDLIHQLLGFKDNAYQSLYHFTIGGALEDERLTTLPPYHHLKK